MKPWITIGSLEVPTYFFVMSFVATFCAFWVRSRAIAQNRTAQLALDFYLIVLVAGMLGARIFHVFYEHPAYYLEAPQRVFELWKGGFVFFGGAFFAMFVAWRFARARREPFEDWLNFFAPVLALGYAVGRIGCFLAGCCYGSSCSLPWAVTFPPGSEAPPGLAIHPTQLYAFIWELFVLSMLLKIERDQLKNQTIEISPNRVVNYPKNPKSRTGARNDSQTVPVFVIWMGLHGVGRFLMELFRGDDRGPTIFGISVSMFISFAIVILSLSILKRRRFLCIPSL